MACHRAGGTALRTPYRHGTRPAVTDVTCARAGEASRRLVCRGAGGKALHAAEWYVAVPVVKRYMRGLRHRTGIARAWV